MQKKCAFVSYSGQLDSFDQLIPDMSIACLLRTLNNHGFDCEFFDLSLPQTKFNDVLNYVANNDLTFVGFKLWGGPIREQLEFAQKIKKKAACSIIAGGPLPRLYEEATLKVTSDIFDILNYGEGEEALIGICDYLEGKKRSMSSIPNIIYRENGEIVKTPIRLLEPDRIPIPAWDKVHLSNYLPILPLNMKRGCQWSCSFCSHPYLWGRRTDSKCLQGKKEAEVRAENAASVRRRPWQSIQKEIDLDCNDYGAQIIDVIDSTPDKRQLDRFCDYINSSKLDLIWCCFGRMGLFDEKFLTKLSLNGCRAIWYGFETGSDIMLQNMHKYVDTKTMAETIILTKKHDIRTVGSFVIAHPKETEATLRETNEFIENVKPDYHSISPYILMPGSHVALNPSEYGVTIHDNWKEKILQGMLAGQNMLELHYYDIQGIPNNQWWAQFKPLSNYRGWYDYRVADNMELVCLLAKRLAVDPDKLAVNLVDILARKDTSALSKFLEKAWRRSGSSPGNDQAKICEFGQSILDVKTA
ncbi:MAG TPA: hypothetical protein HA232_02370 [Methanocellales archaeon]|nr:hypothetical protein [Methanocellales archaeon]